MTQAQTNQSRWTKPADIADEVSSLWSKGQLLRALFAPDIQFPFQLNLRRPTAKELSDDFARARLWVRELSEQSKSATGFGYELAWTESDHRQLGRNRVPVAATIPSLDDALRMIGRLAQANRFRALIAETERRMPQLRSWLAKKPLVALEIADDWHRIVDVLDWFVQHPRPQLYLRQIDIPGIDTKFIEQRRGLLSELLDNVMADEAIDRHFVAARDFEHRFGLRSKPAMVRFRLLDGAMFIGGLSDLTVPVREFACAGLPVERIFITENETNGLTFPLATRSAVVFGLGYGIDMLSACDWLGDRELFYWGDIDTHGFAMLDRLRARFPNVRSILMNREVLLLHRDFWATEASQTGQELLHLQADERQVYDALRRHEFGRSVRLEQERVAFRYVDQAVARALLVAEPPSAKRETTQTSVR